MHGRGGQGVVSAAKMIAEAAILEGKYVQAFPEFGAERSGAPITAYARLSEEPMELHSFIYTPDVVVVVDRTMASVKSTTAGLADDGSFVCNSGGTPSELRTALGLDDRVKVCAIDATAIALKSLGKDIPNTPMLGALVKATQIVRVDSIERALAARFKGALQTSNTDALRRGYEQVQVG